MKFRILLVEDDELIGPLVKEMLCNGGYDVVLARDLIEILLWTDFEFSAVISDYRLLNSDGCDVIGFVRDKKPGLPAILMSGYGPRIANVCAKSGIQNVRFLAKPFSPTELLDAVATQIRLHAPATCPIAESASPFPTTR